jgi:hypothetical protein
MGSATVQLHIAQQKAMLIRVMAAPPMATAVPLRLGMERP